MEETSVTNEAKLEELNKVLEERENEIENLKCMVSNNESVQSLKTQFAHMADTYENKIERLSQEKSDAIDDIKRDKLEIEKELNDKKDLISHLKKDLGNIQDDINRQIKNADAGYIDEMKTLKELNKNFLDDVEELKNENKELESRLKIINNEKITLESQNKHIFEDEEEIRECDMKILEEKVSSMHANHAKLIEEIKHEHNKALEILDSEKSDVITQLDQKILVIKDLEAKLQNYEMKFYDNLKERDYDKDIIIELRKKIETFKISQVKLNYGFEEERKSF